MKKINRNHKDSVFVDLFANDIYAKENFISLYNALHKTNLDPKTTEVQPVMLENILYMSYYNDISMLVDGKIIVLILKVQNHVGLKIKTIILGCYLHPFLNLGI